MVSVDSGKSTIQCDVFHYNFEHLPSYCLNSLSLKVVAGNFAQLSLFLIFFGKPNNNLIKKIPITEELHPLGQKTSDFPNEVLIHTNLPSKENNFSIPPLFNKILCSFWVRTMKLFDEWEKLTTLDFPPNLHILLVHFITSWLHSFSASPHYCIHLTCNASRANTLNQNATTEPKHPQNVPALTSCRVNNGSPIKSNDDSVLGLILLHHQKMWQLSHE